MGRDVGIKRYNPPKCASIDVAQLAVLAFKYCIQGSGLALACATH